MRWLVRTGSQWAAPPERYPPYQTCHRRFQRWVRARLLDRVVESPAAMGRAWSRARWAYTASALHARHWRSRFLHGEEQTGDP